MTLPVDTLLLRHGQSEGNLAKRLSEAGDHAAHNRIFNGRHTQALRLTERGRRQADRAGEWIRRNESPFDRCFVSGYARAMETAARLDLPDVRWYLSPYLTERDWGDVDGLSEEERETQFARVLRMRHVEPYFWTPPNGESFNALALRQERVLDTLHRECSDRRVIIVCHGEVMWAYRTILERIPAHLFREMHLSEDPLLRIHNCQIIHYSRRAPNTCEIAPYVGWMRIIRPASDPVWISPWYEITRQTYSNGDLLTLLDQHYPAFVQ